MLVGAVLLLPACSSPVTVQPAADGASDVCADVVAALPGTVAGASRRETAGGAGTAAWGDPAVLLRCGEEAVVLSSQPCVTVPGEPAVDWVVLASDDQGSIVRTFGRDPAVEVEVPASYGPAPVSVLPDLAAAVGLVPATAVCVA